MKKFILPLIFGLCVLGVWYAARAYVDSSFPERKFMLPYPHQVVGAALENRDQLMQATLSTAVGALCGFLTAVCLSVALAIVLAASGVVRTTLFPYLMLMQMTPIIVIAPILLIWIGPGLLAVTIITFLISFFPLVVNTTQGMISTEQNLVEMYRLYGATRWQEILQLRLPGALPYFFTGLRISAILAPIGAVVGDFFAGNASGGVGGLGFMAVIYSANLNTAALFATAAICCLLGFLLVGLVYLISWHFLHRWHPSYAQEK